MTGQSSTTAVISKVVAEFPISRFLPTGFSSPKYFSEMFLVKTIVPGRLREELSAEPYIAGIVNMSKRLESA